jgi:hypothetical protein
LKKIIWLLAFIGFGGIGGIIISKSIKTKRGLAIDNLKDDDNDLGHRMAESGV